jgi:hypothetical protein
MPSVTTSYRSLGTRAAHCGIFCIASKLGMRPIKLDVGELDRAEGLTLIPLADDTDSRLLRVLPKPVRLVERERLNCPYESGERAELEDEDEADEARRWRCIAVGSTSGSFARRAKSDSTNKAKLIAESATEWNERTINNGDHARDTRGLRRWRRKLIVRNK